MFGSNTIYSLLPKSHKSVQNLIDTDFLYRKRAFKSCSELLKAISVSPSIFGPLRTVLQSTVSGDYKLKTILLALREVQDEHSGENIGQTVVNTIRRL
jgi:hypothetical protein